MEITAQDIIDAHERIKPFIHKTPVLTSKTIDQISGAEIFFKCENFQKIGAFKIRGGMNAVLSLPEEKRKKELQLIHPVIMHRQLLMRQEKLEQKHIS